MRKKSKSNVRHVPEAISATMRPTSVAVLGIAVVFGGMIIFNAFLGQTIGGSRLSLTSDKPAIDSTDKTSRTVTLKYDELVEDIQRELLATGHFQGLVDGVDGPKTLVAIETYQQQNGLAVTGVSSQRLLEHIRFMKKVAQASEFTGSINAVETMQLPDPKSLMAPAPKRLTRIVPEQPTIEPKKPPEKPQAKAIAKPKSKLPEKKPPKAVEKLPGKLLEKLLEKSLVKPTVKVKEKRAAKPEPKQTATLQLQKRLAMLGFDPGTRSGEMDEATRAAILGFELEHGLNMEGKVTKKLLLAMKTAEQKRVAGLQN